MASVYLVTGDNSLEKELKIKALLAKTAGKGGQQGTLSVYHADEITPEEISASFSSLSLFSGASVRLIRCCEDLNTDALAAVADLISHPVAGSVLILEGTRIGTRVGAAHPFNKALKEHGGNVEESDFPSPQSYKVPEWITGFAGSRFNRRIDEGAAKLLHEMVGDDLMTLASEIEKLDILLEPKKPLAAADIKSLTGDIRMRAPWELPPPVARKEIALALSILHNLYDFGHKTVQVLFALSDHFIKLTALKAYFAENAQDERSVRRLLEAGVRGKNDLGALAARILNEVGWAKRKLTPFIIYPVFVVPNVMKQADNFTLEQLRYIVRLVASYDMGQKSGLYKDAPATIERLVYLIVFSDRFRAGTRF